MESLVGAAADDELVRNVLRLNGPREVDEELGAPDVAYWDYLADGVCVVVDASGTVDSIFCYAEGAEDRPGFRGKLPAGVSFAMGRAQLKTVLGLPTEPRDGADTWQVAGVRLRADYFSDGQRVRLLTITR
jgi:hypothetical protein